MGKIKNTAVMVCISLIFIFGSQFSHAALLMTPYLQAVATNSIYVLVESDSTNPITAEYGLSADYGNKAATESIEPTAASPATYIHRIKLTGLQPDAKYHYRVYQGVDYSIDYTFWTAANPGTPFRFAWMADCRSGTGIHDRIAKQIENAHPRFSIYGGDLCSNGAYHSFKNEFFRPNELALIAEVPFFNTVGNHEGWSQNTKAFTQAPDSRSGNQRYYSFDYGDLHVLVLNYMAEKSRNIKASAQFNFAKSDLQGSAKPWKIVISHSPAYCAGGHGEDEVLKVFTKDIFEPNKVNMVISGHSHFYQHNLVNGIHHLVIGSAGAELYTPQTASYTIKSIKDYNYAIVDVSPASMDLVVYNHLGRVLDRIDLAK